MDRDSCMVYIKTDGIYKDIAEDVELDLVLQVMSQTDHYLNEKKKSNWINQRWWKIRWKNYDKVCWTNNKNLQLLNRRWQ